MHTFPAARTIRTVPWSRMPLGCIILQWPQIAGAQIPELADYPVMTERLRHHLGRTYHFLQRRSVTIADPESGLDSREIRDTFRDALQLNAAFAGARAFREEVRTALVSQPDAREGLREQARFDRSPYTITRSLARSTAQILRDIRPFGSGIWPASNAPQEVTARAVMMLTGEAPPMAAATLTVDVGVDVSRSMTMDQRGDFAYHQATEVLGRLAALFPTLSWRLWAISDTTVCVATGGRDADRLVGVPESLQDALRRHSIRPGETHFVPFLRAVSDGAPATGGHLCLLVTDIAEAARGEQLVLTWFPLFSLVTVDVYQQAFASLLV